MLADPNLAALHREDRLTWPEPRSRGRGCWEERAVRFSSEQNSSLNAVNRAVGKEWNHRQTDSNLVTKSKPHSI